MEGGNDVNPGHQVVGGVPQQLAVDFPGASPARIMNVDGNGVNFVGGGAGDSRSGLVFNANLGEGDANSKRRRGRPKKVEPQQQLMLTEDSSASTQKRGRGRPKGSGKHQMETASGLPLPSGDGDASETVGTSFTPCVIIVQSGENIFQRLVSFAEKTAESICIISATGTVARAEMLTPGTLDCIRRYEGEFDVISLSGLKIFDENDAEKRNKLHLSAILANPHGIIFGGSVRDLLIAATPIQLVVATFQLKPNEKPRKKAKVKNPNKVAATAPLQSTPNAQRPAPQANGLSASPLVPTTIDAVEKFINGHDSQISPPFNWTSSTPAMSQRNMPDFNTGEN